tara:strand:+ start:18 stop:215 length:198 start_codon:yes stop_codon:yes gene_type:complete
MRKIIMIPLIYLILTNNAYAYLDPGSGSVILSAIVAVLATIKHYWNLVKNFINQKILKVKKVKNK